MRKTAECAWAGYETNTDIAKRLNITSVLGCVQDYRRSGMR